MTLMIPTNNTKQQDEMTMAYSDFNKGLNLFAYRKVSNRATSEELVQDTFMKTWAHLVRGGKIDVMKAFLYHVLNNLIIDDYRKRKTVSLDALLEKGFEPSGNEHVRAIDMMDGQRAVRMIGNLPVIYQKVMRMRFVQELSLSEISILTGKSKNGIAVQIHRGLGKLKLLYGLV